MPAPPQITETAGAGRACAGKGFVLERQRTKPQMQRLIESVQAEFGRIYALVNNAGITRDNLLMRMKDERVGRDHGGQSQVGVPALPPGACATC